MCHVCVYVVWCVCVCVWSCKVILKIFSNHSRNSRSYQNISLKIYWTFCSHSRDENWNIRIIITKKMRTQVFYPGFILSMHKMLIDCTLYFTPLIFKSVLGRELFLIINMCFSYFSFKNFCSFNRMCTDYYFQIIIGGNFCASDIRGGFMKSTCNWERLMT